MAQKLHAYSLSLTIHEVLAQLRPDERKVIAAIARCDGISPEQLTVQDINFFLGQARHTGELAERYADGSDA
jgi:hypothetical protein